MDDPLYREEILEHWEHPQHYGVLEGASVDISEDNPLCGDRVRITARVNNKRITEVAFTCEGCAIAKAATSLLTGKTTGMPVAEFLKMKPEEFLDFLGISFSAARIKCALLGFSTLQKGLRLPRLK